MAQLVAGLGSHYFHAVDRAWAGPDALPTIGEIRDPGQWIDRIGLLERAAS